MSTLTRNIAPAINEIRKIDYIKATGSKLKNGMPLYHIKAGTQDLVKIEVLFPAGMWQQPGPLIGSAASAMLQEGTSKYSAKALAEMIDFYGAFLHTEITHDFAVVGIHCLNKHLPSVLPLVAELIQDSVFPEKEWNVYVQNKKQSFLVNNQKVNFICRKKFAELLFGAAHPYGYNVSDVDFDKLKRSEAQEFYKKNYSAKDAVVIASGMVNDQALKLIETHFGGIQQGAGASVQQEPKIQTTKGTFLVEKKDAIQSAIRMGRMMFTKSHPDYPALLVMNTIFGGYFGSRLMANIREDKGYTYGIGSAMVAFTHAGYMNIATEVGVEVTSATLKEIHFEMERMRNENVTESELALVRNYMLGTFLRSMDGPFALADRFKGIYFSGLGYDYFDRYFETIQTVSAQRIRQLAEQYLVPSDMIELVVGKK